MHRIVVAAFAVGLIVRAAEAAEPPNAADKAIKKQVDEAYAKALGRLQLQIDDLQSRVGKLEAKGDACGQCTCSQCRSTTANAPPPNPPSVIYHTPPPWMQSGPSDDGCGAGGCGPRQKRGLFKGLFKGR